MGSVIASLAARIPPWMSRKAQAIFEALPKDARAWAERRGKELSHSPSAFNQAQLTTEIRQKFVRAGSNLQAQQSVINGLTSAVLLFALSEMPPPLPGAASSFSGGARQQSAPSIDVETMKLERMIQKRSQLFNMLNQIMEKYDATAKGIIQSLGR